MFIDVLCQKKKKKRKEQILVPMLGIYFRELSNLLSLALKKRKE